MVRVNVRWTRVVALGAIGLTLCGCNAFRTAIGAAKNPPDEFTVLTKAPLVIPPDFNLRPPQPGAAARNEPEADVLAREALFQQNAQAQAASLGTEYSEGEKFLLTRTNALAVDPNIRRRVTSDAGQEDLGADFAQRLLNQPAGTPAQPAQMQAAPPVPPAPAAAPPVPPQAAVAPPMSPQAAVVPLMPQQTAALPAPVARANLPTPAPAPAASEAAETAPAPVVTAANPAPRPELAAAPPAGAEPAAAPPTSQPPAVRSEAPAQPAVAQASINPSPARALSPAVSASASAAADGAFVLQIGAYKNEQTAASALRTLNGRSQTLAQLAPQGVDIVNLGAEGTMYRLHAGRFADRPSAANACEALKLEGVECFVANLASAQSSASGQASLTPFATPAP